jgi:hypothetical protein
LRPLIVLLRGCVLWLARCSSFTELETMLYRTTDRSPWHWDSPDAEETLVRLVAVMLKRTSGQGCLLY